jgi:hypothetical protein
MIEHMGWLRARRDWERVWEVYKKHIDPIKQAILAKELKKKQQSLL